MPRKKKEEAPVIIEEKKTPKSWTEKNNDIQKMLQEAKKNE